MNDAIYLNMRPPQLKKHYLSPKLEQIEKKMEDEILKVLNDTWDTSTVLRRDNILAKLMFDVKGVSLRLSLGKKVSDEFQSNMEVCVFKFCYLFYYFYKIF